MTVSHDELAGTPGGTAEPATVEDLYGLAPDQFTPARNALAKRLRAAGDKATAAEVAKVRKPPVTAWALNQVARQEPTVIEDLVRRGLELRAAMDQALQGDASAVREAQQHERAAVDAAVDAAARHLDEHGHRATEQNRQRMAQTLRAALVDEDAAARLRAGVLDQDVDAAGFGMGGLTGFAPSASASTTAPAPPAPQAAAAPAPADDEQAEAGVPPMPDPVLQRALARATQRLREQEGEASQAAEELERRVDAMKAVQAELEDVQRRLDAAQRAVRDAEGAATQAQARLEEARRARDAADAALQQDGAPRP